MHTEDVIDIGRVLTTSASVWWRDRHTRVEPDRTWVAVVVGTTICRGAIVHPAAHQRHQGGSCAVNLLRRPLWFGAATGIRSRFLRSLRHTAATVKHVVGRPGLVAATGRHYETLARHRATRTCVARRCTPTAPPTRQAGAGAPGMFTHPVCPRSALCRAPGYDTSMELYQ
jgi:hypothetical protein